MSAHTPGPWRVKGALVLPPNSCGVPECCGIAECFHGSNQELAEANARLISAAPDLLAALQAALLAKDACFADAELMQANDAIAKALGVVSQ